ncbi:MAG: hypothetical protein R3C97_14015 [Geminicoccaceae bacterium]
MTLPIAIFAYFIAPRVDGNRAVWTIFGIIPLVNMIFAYYMAYRIVAHVLDRLNGISSRLGAQDQRLP